MTPTVYTRRLGRLVFGSVLLLGVLTLFAMLERGVVTILIGTWCTALVASALARRLAVTAVKIDPPDALAQLGLAVPLAGIALIGPLTFDMLLVPALGGTDGAGDFPLGLGVAHACFAICCAIHGCQLAQRTEPLSLRWICLFTLVASWVPMGIFVLAIPLITVYVSLTRIPFLLTLRAAARIAAREHDELAGVAPLPRAITRSA